MKQKYSPILFLALSLLVWAYLWLRAYYVPLVHDEIATFHNYIQIGKFLPWDAHWDANNHILNSAISALMYNIFGLSPLVIRLGNLIMFPVFCLFVWKSGKFFSHLVIRWVFFLSLLLCHGFLEFFGLSRGYGISMAFLMPALYYLIRMTERYSRNRMIAVIGWSACATLANLSLLNTFLLFILYLILFAGFSGQLNLWKQRISVFGWITIAAIPLMILFTLISFELKARGLLYTGGGNGLWEDTVKTLFLRLFSSENPILMILIAALFGLSVGISIIRLFREKSIFSPKLVYLIFLSGNLLGAILLHLFFGVNYPENRVALFLFPLFTGSLCFAADDLARYAGIKPVLLFLAPLALIPGHFVMHLNLTHAGFYIEDLVPAGFYHTVRKNHQAGEYPAIVSGKRLRHFCWSFYDFREGGTESQITSTNFPETKSDYQIADAADMDFFKQDYLIIDSTAVNHRYLLKRKKLSTRTLVGQSPFFNTPGFVREEFVSLFSGNIALTEGESYYLGMTAEIISPVEPFHSWIVAEVRDSSGKTLQYERISLYWFRPAWNEANKHFKNGLFLSNVPSGASSLKLYVWNIEKDPFRIENGVVQLYRLE